MEISSCILQGDNSVGEFYFIAITNNHQSRYGNKNDPLRKNTRAKSFQKEFLPEKQTILIED